MLVLSTLQAEQLSASAGHIGSKIAGDGLCSESTSRSRTPSHKFVEICEPHGCVLLVHFTEFLRRYFWFYF